MDWSKAKVDGCEGLRGRHQDLFFEMFWLNKRSAWFVFLNCGAGRIQPAAMQCSRACSHYGPDFC